MAGNVRRDTVSASGVPCAAYEHNTRTMSDLRISLARERTSPLPTWQGRPSEGRVRWKVVARLLGRKGTRMRTDRGGSTRHGRFVLAATIRIDAFRRFASRAQISICCHADDSSPLVPRSPTRNNHHSADAPRRECQCCPHAEGLPRSFTSWLICLNSGASERSHHSNRTDSVVVMIAPPPAMRSRAIRQSSSLRLPTASAGTKT